MKFPSQYNPNMLPAEQNLIDSPKKARLISNWITGILIVVTILASLQLLKLGERKYNNYLIFKYCFPHLLQNENIYARHPAHHGDLFKYSPTFALLAAPLYWLPTWAGLIVWNLLNALLPWLAIKRLDIPDQARFFVAVFGFTELLTSVQNAQSNGLVLGLMILAFTAFEREKVLQAALWIALAGLIKLFGLAAAVLFVFYPRKVRFLLALSIVGGALILLPALFTGIHPLVQQYRNWGELLRNDPAHDLNYSIMTLTERWFKVHVADKWFLGVGLALMLAPLARVKQWKNFAFRLLMLAGLLIWVVIFNHKAESPTYTIAVAGVGLWAILEPNSIVRWSLAGFVLLLTSLGPTDLVPRAIKVNYWTPLCLKALPCIVVWGWITAKLLSGEEMKISFPAVATIEKVESEPRGL